MMTVLLIILVIIAISCLAFSIYNIIKLKQTIQSEMICSSPINPETRNLDMKMVNDAIDVAICKSLYYYTERDIYFSEKSPVRSCLKGHFRDLIGFLLRSDLTIDETLEDGTIVHHSFFDLFVQRVYLLYNSETSENVKRLFFKYYSGFTFFNYNTKNANPSIIYYLTNYITNFLFKVYYSKEEFENTYLSMLEGGEPDLIGYEKMMEKYDDECIVKLRLNTYNVNDIEVKSILPKTSYPNETKDKEKKE